MGRRANLAIVAVSAAGLAGLFGLTWHVADDAGVTLGLHGWIAVGLGSVISLAVSGVLFGLTFYSARSGHDDQAGPRA